MPTEVDTGRCGARRTRRPKRGTSWKPSIVAELAEVISHDAVNPEYRHLAPRLQRGGGPGGARAILPAALPAAARRAAVPATADEPLRRRPGQASGRVPLQGHGRRHARARHAQAGDRLDIMGPLGRWLHAQSRLAHVVAVGRGAGLATLAPLAQAARKSGIDVTALFSARRPDLLVSVDLFRSHGADVITVTDSESTSGPANVERILRRSSRTATATRSSRADRAA